MKLKAQNTIEIITMVSLVVVVVLSAFMFMNGHNNDIASLSSINTGGNTSVKQIIKNNDISTNFTTKTGTIDAETAGSLSSIVVNMKDSELLNALNNKTIDDVLAIKTDDGKDVFDLANELIKEYQGQITVSPFEDKLALNDDTKKDLVKVKFDTKAILDKTQKTNSTYDEYIAILAVIISY